jgi:hypothetical protein
MNQTMSLPLWALYVQAFLGPAATVAAAVVAAWITYRIQGGQLRTARDKLKLDLFERRYRTFDVVLDTLSEVVRAGEPTWEQLRVLHNQVLEARFLFKEPLVDWLRSIETQAEDLLRSAEKVTRLSENDRRSPQEQARLERFLDEAEPRKQFLRQALQELERRFAPYLSFAHVAS